MPSPHEIVAAPLTVYLAPTGTAFPAVDAAPAVAWKKLGTEGAHNYDEEGVSLTSSQTIESFTPAGSPRARKAWRTEEGLTVGFTLVDLSPEQYARVHDDATITTVAAGAGTAGSKKFELARGVNVKTFALLARGESSVDNGLAMQLELATVYQSAEPEISFKKGEPAGLALEFTALEAVIGEFGRWNVQTAAAS